MLYPFVPPDDVDQAVCDAITDVLVRVPRRSTSRLTHVETFPDGVVYLAPEPADPFVAITKALAAHWPEHPPYHGAFTSVIPHLSVAMITNGSLDALEAELNGGLPVRTRADAVWLMEGQPEDRWVDPRGVPAQRRSNVKPAASRSQVASVTPSSRSSYLSTRPTGLRGRSVRNSM